MQGGIGFHKKYNKKNEKALWTVARRSGKEKKLLTIGLILEGVCSLKSFLFSLRGGFYAHKKVRKGTFVKDPFSRVRMSWVYSELHRIGLL